MGKDSNNLSSTTNTRHYIINIDKKEINLDQMTSQNPEVKRSNSGAWKSILLYASILLSAWWLWTYGIFWFNYSKDMLAGRKYIFFIYYCCMI